MENKYLKGSEKVAAFRGLIYGLPVAVFFWVILYFIVSCSSSVEEPQGEPVYLTPFTEDGEYKVISIILDRPEEEPIEVGIGDDIVTSLHFEKETGVYTTNMNGIDGQMKCTNNITKFTINSNGYVLSQEIELGCIDDYGVVEFIRPPDLRFQPARSSGTVDYLGGYTMSFNQPDGTFFIYTFKRI